MLDSLLFMALITDTGWIEFFQSFPFFERIKLPYLTLTSIGSREYEQESASKEQGQQSNGGSEDDMCHTREQEERAEREQQEKDEVEQNRCTTPGGTVEVVPYRPPSASRTYFMAVSHGWCLLLILTMSSFISLFGM